MVNPGRGLSGSKAGVRPLASHEMDIDGICSKSQTVAMFHTRGEDKTTTNAAHSTTAAVTKLRSTETPADDMPAGSDTPQFLMENTAQPEVHVATDNLNRTHDMKLSRSIVDLREDFARLDAGKQSLRIRVRM